MNQHHYLGFERFAGRGLRYVFEWRSHWVGLAGWQSGAFKCRPRDRWKAQLALICIFGRYEEQLRNWRRPIVALGIYYAP